MARISTIICDACEQTITDENDIIRTSYDYHAGPREVAPNGFDLDSIAHEYCSTKCMIKHAATVAGEIEEVLAGVLEHARPLPAEPQDRSEQDIKTTLRDV